MNKRMMWMLIITAVVFGGLFGMKWFGNKMMNQFFDTMPVPAAAVSSAKAEALSWRATIAGVGTVVASQGTRISSESGGLVAKVHFESGAKVKRGDLLVTLSAGSEQADLARLQSQATLAKSELSRLQRLYSLEAISKSDLDRAETDFRAAQSAADGQRAKLAQKQIRAPFSGQLGIRQVDVGQYLTPGETMVTLQQLDPVYVDFSLPEQDVLRVATGQAVNITLDAQADRVFTGVISAIEPQVDVQTRNFKVRANVANADRALRPGQFARAEIALPAVREVVAVPITAVSYNPYGNSVYVIVKAPTKAAEPGAAGEQSAEKAADEQLIVRRRFIKTGEARGDLVEITEGLSAGDTVATSGLLKLQNDAKVIINNTVMPPASAAPTPAES
ncbi:membrane fusion protein (multidrug efflux system) [Paraperlucidibaca baekdonensis]|uniref:Membrane fusion protein (Multidrug efflux system) n=1 Tax=Paraperlucidibaca baekdonensis TaxID=748120 RepID=A0A3E0H9C1_9GAMM|nr:efflux RND transporter periplasmic adaptor subunit [Paraperlucidibaca baekdonensis]REH40253.1 membrane fusion protein (multidrug efflux system) [Paraperlucidibaca baekdonensis]